MQLYQKCYLIVNRPVVARYQNASHNPKSKKVSGIRRSKIWRNSGNANYFSYSLMKNSLAVSKNRSSEVHINQGPGVFQTTDNQSHI